MYMYMYIKIMVLVSHHSNIVWSGIGCTIMLLRQGKARQLRLGTTPPFFRREKEELDSNPQCSACYNVHVVVRQSPHLNKYVFKLAANQNVTTR